MAPLGSRKSKDSQREPGPQMFDPILRQGWQPTSKEESNCQFLSKIQKGVASIKNMVDMGDGYEDIKHYIKVNKDLMALMEGDCDEKKRKKIENLKVELNEICEVFLEKLEREDKTMKDISKMMAELEEEIVRYLSDRNTNKYKNVQNRMITLTRQLSSFKPAREQNIKVKAKHNARLSELWQKFETRSDNLVDILEQQMTKDVACR